MFLTNKHTFLSTVTTQKVEDKMMKNFENFSLFNNPSDNTLFINFYLQ